LIRKSPRAPGHEDDFGVELVAVTEAGLFRSLDRCGSFTPFFG
jgi:hypothetical protein